MNEFYNSVILVDYSTTAQMNTALAGKQNLLPVASPDFNYVLFSSSGTILWKNEYDFILRAEYENAMLNKLNVGTYNAFLVTNQAALDAKQNLLNFTTNGEIAIWDGVNNEIAYIVLD